MSPTQQVVPSRPLVEAFVWGVDNTDNNAPIHAPVTLLSPEGYTDFLIEAKFGVR